MKIKKTYIRKNFDGPFYVLKRIVVTFALYGKK